MSMTWVTLALLLQLRPLSVLSPFLPLLTNMTLVTACQDCHDTGHFVADVCHDTGHFGADECHDTGHFITQFFPQIPLQSCFRLYTKLSSPLCLAFHSLPAEYEFLSIHLAGKKLPVCWGICHLLLYFSTALIFPEIRYLWMILFCRLPNSAATRDMDIVPLKKSYKKYAQNVYILFQICKISKRKCGTETFSETVLQ